MTTTKSQIQEKYREYRENSNIRGNDALVDDTPYRVAFPSYRVFIFGNEVTDDVLSVRVTNSGGSAERSAGSCMITLANKHDKYVYTHDDMVKISKAKSVATNIALGRLPANNSETMSFSNQKVEPPKLSVSGRDFSAEDLVEFASKLKLADSEQKTYLIGAFFGPGVASDTSTAETLSRKIIGYVNDTYLNRVLAYDAIASNEQEANFSDLTFLIKESVLAKKLSFTSVAPGKNAVNDSRSADTPQKRVIFDYPMNEGDCIFNPNDPIRVAFRDPFQPTTWYWMFSGFMDSFTESVNENRESIINITATDVTKMLRYAITQIRVSSRGANTSGGKDLSINDSLQQLYGFTNAGNYVSSTSYYANSALFSGLTILEILELLFFGSESSRNLIGYKYSDLASLEINNILKEYIEEYQGNPRKSVTTKVFDILVNVYKLDPNKIAEIMGKDKILSSGEYVDWTGNTELLKVVSQDRYSQKLSTLDNLNFPPLTAPGDIQFRRAREDRGIHYYVIGEPDAYDQALGAKAIKDLNEWNELIHHRVRVKDVDDMKVNPSGARFTGSDGDYQTIFDVITKIGSDVDTYPVGGGGVYFLTMAKVEGLTEASIVDKGFGSLGSFHASYKDRLTMLYDLANSVDFRFYGTPKGDVVFEVPFYDFDPDEFWVNPEIENADRKNDSIKTYESIFSEAYSGNYTDNASYKDLTALQFIINAENGNLEKLPVFLDETNSVFDYATQFTIDISEQIGFSNTLNDQGLVTVAIAKPQLLTLLPTYNNAELVDYVQAYAPELIPSLGVRVVEEGTWITIDTVESAALFAKFTLNRLNSEARNCSIQVSPKFGLMVNRPLWWKYRNQFCNIVSLDHSITWNSDVSTTVSVNQVRAWDGSVDDRGNYIHQRFGGADKFNWYEILKRTSLGKGKFSKNSDPGVS